MKKLVVFALIVVAVLSAGYVYADDGEKMTFDNVVLGKEYKIRGYVAVNFYEFTFVDAFMQWEQGVHETKSRGWDEGHPASLQTSGNEADFAWLKADVRNLGKTNTKFRTDISVKVIYDDEYEYKGWVRQFNYDYSTAMFRFDEVGIVGGPSVLNPNDEEIAIGPLYVGHYVFGCTLPMPVIDDKDAPLRMIITMKDNEFTYNIR